MNKVYVRHAPTAMKKDFQPGQYVTIFTDASHDPDTGATGWAGWCKHGTEGNTIRESDIDITDNSTMAELLGLTEMLNRLIANGEVVFAGKNVVIQCDNIGALNALNLEPLRALKVAHIKLKHVKAHTGNTDARSKVNNWCDKQAGRLMRELRSKLQAADRRKNKIAMSDS